MLIVKKIIIMLRKPEFLAIFSHTVTMPLQLKLSQGQAEKPKLSHLNVNNYKNNRKSGNFSYRFS